MIKTMQTISIELQIANRKYPLRLNEAEAEIAREAARRVNASIQLLEKQYGVKDLQDLFAMAALQITSELVKSEQDTQKEKIELSKKLEELEQEIDFIKP
jgi:cell division protein ZapA